MGRDSAPQPGDLTHPALESARVVVSRLPTARASSFSFESVSDARGLISEIYVPR